MIPRELTYSSIKPKGWYTRFKQWPIQPLSSNMYWTPTQILRFQIMQTQGVMDPYRSHLVMYVSAPPIEKMPIGGLQVDGSAQSFISQLVITSKNIEIQRITQYDTLSAYATDMGISEAFCQNREQQGLGHQNFEISPAINHQRYSNSSMWYQQHSNGAIIPVIQSNIDGGCFSPTKVPCSNIQTTSSSSLFPSNTNSQIQTFSTASHLTSTNYLHFKNNVGNMKYTPQQVLNRNTRFMNLRSQYDPTTTLRNYIDTPTGYRNGAPKLKDRPIDWTNKGPMLANTTYSLDWNQTLSVSLTGAEQQSTISNIPNISSIFGYQKPYSSKFGVGAFQPMISPTIPQCQFAYGQVLSHPIPITQRRFVVPLMSSTIGLLIPNEQYKLIPVAALNGMLFQITLSQYAMFSTGKKDCHQFDTIGAKTPLPRQYRVGRVYYNMHIYEWPQNQIKQYLQDALTKQIAISSVSWGLSAQYQLPSGQYARNNWPVNVSAQSLCQIVCLFISNEYMKYPHCRKQFRLSNNIRSMQIKFGTDYHPPQPIVGNAGNPQQVDNSGSNAEYMMLLLGSNNYLYITNVPQPMINKYNFAINGRCYDPSNQAPLYDPNLLQNTNYTWTVKSINGDTAMGQSYFHQNRYIGKAAFVYSFQPLAHSKQYMVGVDTRNSRPFDVIFDASSTNFFPSDETLYIFTRINTVNIYTDGQIKVFGR